jgi:hypothetical protein
MEMEMQTTMRFNLVLIRIVVMKETENNEYGEECGKL